MCNSFYTQILCLIFEYKEYAVSKRQIWQSNMHIIIQTFENSTIFI